MSSARVVALLLLLHPHPIPASGVFKSWPFMLDSGPRTNNDDEPGFTAEKWGTNNVQTESTDEHRTITVRGNNRVYAVEDINVRDWAEVRYHKFPILDKQLSFSVDLSGVKCGCNAAVYLVAMPARGSADPKNPAAYCDIQGYDRGIPACVELDVLEGNAKAIQTTLHTSRGHGMDGSCNQDGCVANWGKAHHTAHLYGPGAQEGVDSSRPFEVVASFKEMEDWQSQQHTLGVQMDVSLSQVGPNGRVRSVHFFDGSAVGGSHAAPNERKPIPQEDKRRTRDALINPGVALVVSLWKAEDLSWLDGGCEQWIAQGRGMCDLESTSFSISNLRVSEIPKPPPPPPPQLPPPAAPRSVLLVALGFVVRLGFAWQWVLAIALTVVAAVLALRSSLAPRWLAVGRAPPSLRGGGGGGAGGGGRKRKVTAAAPAVVPSAADDILGDEDADEQYR
jgi:hypothetical protein